MAGDQETVNGDEHQGDNPNPEGARVESLNERFGKIEQEQAAQRGMLEQIRDAIAGKGEAGPAHAAAEKRTQDRLANPPAQDIAAQVRAAVKEVGAEQAAADADKQHKADHDRLREQAERPPREAMGRARSAASRVMFGRPE